MTHDEIIAVVQAHKNGKALEMRDDPANEWRERRNLLEGNPPTFNFAEYEYRIKPEPLECWVTVNDSGNFSGLHTKKSTAEEEVKTWAGRVVHMREVLP